MEKRRTVSIVVLLVLIVLLLPLALLLLVPPVSTTVAERAISSASGMEANLDALEVDLFPPRVDGHGLKLQPVGSDFVEPAMSVETFALSVDPGRWWDDAPTWWSGTASGVTVRAARNREGAGNWPAGEEDGDEAPADPREEEASPAYRFSAVEVENLDFYRIVPAATHHVAVERLSVGRDADERLRFSLDGRWREQAVSASGSVPLPGSERARDVDVEARLPGSVLTVNGTVGHDGVVPGRADFTIEADNLELVELLLDRDLSPFEPLSLQGRLEAPQLDRWALAAEGEVGTEAVDIAAALQTTGAALEIENLDMSYGANEIEATGRVNTDRQSATLDLKSQFIDIDKLMSLAGEGPATDSDAAGDPLAFASQWALDLALSLDEVVFRDYRAERIEGDLHTSEGELRANAQLARLAGMAAAGGQGGAASDWAVTDLQLEAKLHRPGERNGGPAENGGGRRLTAQLTAAGIDADLEASLAAGNLRLRRGTVDAKVKDFAAVSGFDMQNPPWRNLLPLTVNVTASPRDGGWELDPLRVVAGGNDLEGRLTVDPTRQPLYVSGRLQSRLIDINRIRMTSRTPGNGAAAGGGEGAAPDGEPAGDGDVFSDEPLDWGWLGAATVGVDLSVAELHFNQTVFQNASMPINLSEGVLRIDPLSADLTEGNVRGHAAFERLESGARVDAKLIVTNLKPADLGIKDAGLIDGGNTDLLLNLGSRGDSPQALAGNLTGEIALEVQSATIRNDLFEVIGSDLVAQAAELINPFTRRDDSTELQCAAAYFVAKDGVLQSSDTLVIETSKMKIRGSGRLNLDEEALRLDFSPSARSGLGVSLGDLSSVVRIGGTLSHPRVKADPSGVAKAGASIGAAVATGGLSLLAQGLFDRARNAGGTACGKIFEKAPQTEVPAKITPSL